jgi:hypothetical protein
MQHKKALLAFLLCDRRKQRWKARREKVFTAIIDTEEIEFSPNGSENGNCEQAVIN